MKTVTHEYRLSKRVEHHEVGHAGRAGALPVRPAAPGTTYRIQYQHIQRVRSAINLKVRDRHIPELHRYCGRHQKLKFLPSRSTYPDIAPPFFFDAAPNTKVKLPYRAWQRPWNLNIVPIYRGFFFDIEVKNFDVDFAKDTGI